MKGIVDFGSRDSQSNNNGNPLSLEVSGSSSQKLSVIHLIITAAVTGTAPATTKPLSSLISSISIVSSKAGGNGKSTTTDGGTTNSMAQLAKYLHEEMALVDTDPAIAASATTYTGEYEFPFEGSGPITVSVNTQGVAGFTAVTGLSVTLQAVGIYDTNNAQQRSFIGKYTTGQTSFNEPAVSILAIGSTATDVATIWSTGSIGGNGISAVQATGRESFVDAMTTSQYLVVLNSPVNVAMSVSLTQANVSIITAS